MTKATREAFNVHTTYYRHSDRCVPWPIPHEIIIRLNQTCTYTTWKMINTQCDVQSTSDKIPKEPQFQKEIIASVFDMFNE